MNSTILFRIIINKNTKNCKKNRGWAKSPAPLLRVRVNISAQWLIGRFVRVLHSKSDLINCAGVGRRTLFLTSRVLSHSLFLFGKRIFQRVCSSYPVLSFHFSCICCWGVCCWCWVKLVVKITLFWLNNRSPSSVEESRIDEICF